MENTDKNDRPISDELLIDYVLGEIDPDDKARLDVLLAERPELMREARALKRLTSHMGVSMIMPPPRLVSRTRHAAYAAKAKARGWRGLLAAALRRPVTAAAAALVVVALVVAVVGPSLRPGQPGDATDGPTGIGSAATVVPPDVKTFLEDNLGHLKMLSRGEAPEDLSIPAARAKLLLAENPELSDVQQALLQDIESFWRDGYERVNAAGRLSDEIMAELRRRAADARLAERTEALLE